MHGVTLCPDDVAGAIDELMLLALLCTQCQGTSVLRGLGELRVKESDRLQALIDVLTGFGARLVLEGDDLHIDGPTPLRFMGVAAGGALDTRRDHRVVQLALLAALFQTPPGARVPIEGTRYLDDSYPGLLQQLRTLSGDTLRSAIPGEQQGGSAS